VVVKEPEIGSTDLNILIGNNSMDVELHRGMPAASGDFEDEDDKSNECDAIPTASWRRGATTELETLCLGTSDVKGYEGMDGNDADGEEAASQPDDGSTQNVGDWGYSTRECEDWTENLRPVKYDGGEVNATASAVCEAKTVLW